MCQAWRREMVSWMEEVMGECLMEGLWQEAGTGQERGARDPEPSELCPLSPTAG